MLTSKSIIFNQCSLALLPEGYIILFADINRYWGFPTLLLLVQHLFAFVSLFPLYLTGIDGNLPEKVSSIFLFTKLLLAEIILITCLAISYAVVFLHPQFPIGGVLHFVVLMCYQRPCFYYKYWDLFGFGTS